jgi:hypothetical protein
MKFMALAIVSAVTFSGCKSLGRLDGSVQPPGAHETYFVIGVKPDNYHVMLWRGQVNDGRFGKLLMKGSAVFGGPIEGYVVGKADAGDVLAVTDVFRYSSPSGIYPTHYTFCGDAQTEAFKMPGGKVVYLGSLEYDYATGGLAAMSYSDLEDAQKFMAKNYPALAGKLETVRGEKVKPPGACVANVMSIPVYIPRSR